MWTPTRSARSGAAAPGAAMRSSSRPPTAGCAPRSASSRWRTARTGCTACAPSTTGSRSCRAWRRTAARGSSTGRGRLVNPREEIMVPTPERRATRVKADVDSRVPAQIPLAAVDEILDYRPIDAARTLTKPLLVIGVENDTTTPTDHAVALYEAARGSPRAHPPAPHLPLRVVRGQRRGDRSADRGVVRPSPGRRAPRRPVPARERRRNRQREVRPPAPPLRRGSRPGQLLAGARRAEALGFDSLWVRDHLLYEPHGEMERPDRTFYEALTTLTVVGTVTTRIGLGHRRAHPVPASARARADGDEHDASPRSAPHPRPWRRSVRPRVRGGGPRLGRPARPPPRPRREPAAGHDRERRHVPRRRPSSSSA